MKECKRGNSALKSVGSNLTRFLVLLTDITMLVAQVISLPCPLMTKYDRP